MRHFRKERVANLIREIVSEALTRKLNDPRLEPLTTITRVEVTSDIMFAKVFLNVPGGTTAENKTLRAVQHATKFVQHLVAKELNIRTCPEIRFELDNSLKATRSIMDILDENRAELHKIDKMRRQESANLDQDADPDNDSNGTESEDQHTNPSVEP